ncbi:MAG: hypothetical protein E7578_01500 [Ruminococcaceae bacterium]|nr:hypothetical protein [Oscillospiraceae bacterium]
MNYKLWKKTLSAFFVTMILFTLLAVGVGAVGTNLFYDDFSHSFSPANWMLRGGYDTCAYIWDHNNKYLYGQDDAIVLQSNFVDGGKMWNDHYYSIDVRLQEGALGRSDTSKVILQFKDLFESSIENTPTYSYVIIPQTGETYLEKELYYTDKNGDEGYTRVKIDRDVITDKIEIDPSAEWFNIGMRITKGAIRCYFNEKLILESVCDPDDTKLGRYNQNTPDSTVGTQRYPLVFINYDNVLNVDNFQVWTGDYDFNTLPGDVNGDGKTNISDVSRLLQNIAGWRKATVDILQVDLNGDGSKNLGDATILLKYIAGWDVTLG